MIMGHVIAPVVVVLFRVLSINSLVDTSSNSYLFFLLGTSFLNIDIFSVYLVLYVTDNLFNYLANADFCDSCF